MTKLIHCSVPVSDELPGLLITSDMPNTIFHFEIVESEIKLAKDCAYISGLMIPLILSPNKIVLYESLIKSYIDSRKSIVREINNLSI